MALRKPDGRNSLELRPISIETGIIVHAEGSALIRTGNTHVLCTASIEESVPNWMAGKKRGWVTGEYSMLPRATHTRTKRERDKVSGRTQEIQRLIGRALRSCVDLSQLGERSIVVDCDVLQADGGTRTASITGGCVALAIALKKLIRQGKVAPAAWVDLANAISIGLRAGETLVDLDYQEDSTCDVDMNLVFTGDGQIVEIQGTGEQKPFSQKDLMGMIEAAWAASQKIRGFQTAAIQKASDEFLV